VVNYQQSKFTFAQFVTVVSGCELPPALLPTPVHPSSQIQKVISAIAFPRAGAVDEEELNEQALISAICTSFHA
jgi:hypothetical protein